MSRHQDVIKSQTRTRDRVRDLAEVYTHKHEVDAMLDLIADMFPDKSNPRNIGRTFLEPSCGSGNFLVAILERKLAFVTTRIYRSTATFQTAVLRATSSIYGIDIDQSNVDASRGFMRAEIAHHVNLQLNTQAVGADFWSAVETILSTNIRRADTLKDAASVDLVEYHWGRKTGYVTRTWTYLDERDRQLDLFARGMDDLRRDAVPIHFSALATSPHPVSRDESTKERAIS